MDVPTFGRGIFECTDGLYRVRKEREREREMGMESSGRRIYSDNQPKTPTYMVLDRLYAGATYFKMGDLLFPIVKRARTMYPRLGMDRRPVGLPVIIFDYFEYSEKVYRFYVWRNYAEVGLFTVKDGVWQERIYWEPNTGSSLVSFVQGLFDGSRTPGGVISKRTSPDKFSLITGDRH